MLPQFFFYNNIVYNECILDTRYVLISPMYYAPIILYAVLHK